MIDHTSSTDPSPLVNARVADDLSRVNMSGLLGYRSAALPTWCPGCGYYGIAHGITHALNAMSIDPARLVVVSGIGCAGRFPFFVNAYGFHTVHGRAVPIGCGVKMANPELTVLIVGGDGDGFGIGGGHIPHAIRRNVNVTYIVFDNAIYGLTKGQASPTTPAGQTTGTSPFGTVEDRINPALMCLGYGASFLGTGYAGFPDQLAPLIQAAVAHRGFSILIVTTPCITFDHTNITYDRFRSRWEPVPPDHDPSDLHRAVDLVLSGKHLTGILFQDTRPDWEARQQGLRDRITRTGD
ncbi:2-oxoacid:ferredoxin oxidoreductase subunit beta [bacterium]|nr:2-oxoacid:ferredoxin oxidoreductase subunit beta [candidate division CSSED10-310 bacterium]